MNIYSYIHKLLIGTTITLSVSIEDSKSLSLAFAKYLVCGTAYDIYNTDWLSSLGEREQSLISNYVKRWPLSSSVTLV